MGWPGWLIDVHPPDECSPLIHSSGQTRALLLINSYYLTKTWTAIKYIIFHSQLDKCSTGCKLRNGDLHFVFFDSSKIWGQNEEGDGLARTKIPISSFFSNDKNLGRARIVVYVDSKSYFSIYYPWLEIIWTKKLNVCKSCCAQWYFYHKIDHCTA